MLVRNFMVSDVVTLSPDQTCQAALQELQRCKVRRAPVVQNNKLVGIVSERDLLRVMPGTCAQASTEPAELADVQHDYVKLCLEHGCRVHTVLKYPTATGSTMYYLCVAGADVDAFVRKLWAMSNQVVLVE